MKLFLSCLLSVFVSYSNAQNAFTLSDSTFEVGQTFTTHNVRFELNKRDLRFDDVCQPVLDSMLIFFQNHPEMLIEIGVHSDSRGRNHRSTLLTESRAWALHAYFVELGIKESQIMPTGFEDSNPIHIDAYINQFKDTDKEMYHRLHQENRRVVLKVIEIK